MRTVASEVELSQKSLCETDRKDPQHKSVLTNIEALIFCISRIFTEVVDRTRQEPPGEGVFYCRSKPSISIENYLKRIVKFTNCRPVSLVLILIYFDRFQAANPEFLLNDYSVHRFLICAVMEAEKYSEDYYFSNQSYSKVGGISVQIMNKLEKQFLEILNFNLFVKPSEIDNYVEKLDTYMEINSNSPEDYIKERK